MSPLQAARQMMNQALRFLDSRLTKLGDRIEKAQKSPVSINTTNLEKRMDEQNAILARVMGHIQKSANRPVDVKGSIKTNNRDVVRAISSAGDKALTAEKKTQEEIGKNRQVEEGIIAAVAANNEAQKQLYDMVNQRIDALMKAMKIPETFKLDEQQFRALSYRGGGGTAVLGGGERFGTHAKITRVTLTATNTEYSHTFSKNCVGYTIKLDEQNAKLYFAWASGKMPAGGDSSEYMTAPQNYLHTPPNFEPAERTIYLGSDTASVTCEIEEIIA